VDRFCGEPITARPLKGLQEETMIIYKAHFVLDPRAKDKRVRQEIMSAARRQLSAVSEIQTLSMNDKNYHDSLVAVIKREDLDLNLCVLGPVRTIQDNLLYGFELVKLEANFDNARLPACRFTTYRKGKYHSGGVLSSTGPQGNITIQCNADAETVVVTSSRPERGGSWLEWGALFEPTCLNIVRMLHATEAARRLTVAVRSKNRGQIRRLETKMFEAIGHFFDN
jgi:hypothetical protein